MAATAGRGVGAGDDVVVGVAAGAAAGDLGVGAGPTAAGRRSARSRTNAAPPSPRTKPSRPRSNGRDAAAGSSLRRDRARRLPKVARPIGVTARSQAPARQTSTSPSRSQCRPISRAWLPLAQAAESASAGPERPRSRRTRSIVDSRVLVRVVDPRAARAGGRPPRAASTRRRGRAPGRPAPRGAAPRAGVAQGRLDAPDARAAPAGAAPRTRGDRSPGGQGIALDLAGDPAGVVGRSGTGRPRSTPDRPASRFASIVREVAAQRASRPRRP